MSQALYRKWRPQSWEAVVGQDHIIQTLRNAIAAGRVVHAFLFAGPRGTGKTTTARLLAKAVNCLDEDLGQRPCNRCANCLAVNQGRFLDLIEIDAASNTSVEDVRDLRDKINFAPNIARMKVYIVDEVHMLSSAAFNALLKTLEEPPPHAMFILATTEAHKIPATVASRCQRHEFRRIPVAEMTAHLKSLAEQEGIQVDAEALQMVARQSTGALRDAISLLDQLASTGEKVTLEMAQAILGTAASQSVLGLVQAVIGRRAAEGLDLIHAALDAGSDPRQFARQVVGYLRSLLLVKAGASNEIDATLEVRSQMAKDAQALSGAELLRLIRLFNFAGNEARSAWQPALPLEMAFIEALEDPAPAPTTPAAEPPPQQAAPAKKPALQRPAPQEANPTADAAPDLAPVELPGPSSSTDAAFKHIQENWRQVAALVRQFSPSTQALLNSCKPAGIKDGALYLAFNSEFSKNKMELGSNLEYTRRALAQVAGSDMPVRCFVAIGKGNMPPELESDGMVAAALRDLGGEIVDVH